MRLYFPNTTRPKLAAKYICGQLSRLQLSTIHEVIATTCGYQNWYDFLKNYNQSSPSLFDQALCCREFHHRLALLTERFSRGASVGFDAALHLLAASRLTGSREITERDREGVAAVLSARHLASQLELAGTGHSERSYSEKAMASARVAIRRVLERHPKLHAGGWGTSTRISGKVGMRWPVGEELVAEREALLSDRYVHAFIECEAWLWRAIFRRTIPKNPHHSYNLKHEVERVHDIYVPNGAFIAAALNAGLKLQERYNPYFNLCRANVLHAHREYRKPDGTIIHGGRIPGVHEHLTPSDVRIDPSRYNARNEYALYAKVEWPRRRWGSSPAAAGHHA